MSQGTFSDEAAASDIVQPIAVNAFDGLREPISSLTRTSRPSTLLSAYQHALDQGNAASRRREKFRLETKPIERAPQKPTQSNTQFKQISIWNQNKRPVYFGNQNTRPPFKNYPNPQYLLPNFPQQPNHGVRQPLVIKQEAPSESNIRRYSYSAIMISYDRSSPLFPVGTYICISIFMG